MTASGVEDDTAGFAKIADDLRRTRPWVRFLSILIFVAAGFLLLAGASVLLVGGLAATSMAGVRGGTAIMRATGIGYMVLAPIYVVPGVLMWTYASAIEVFVRSSAMADLERAINAQRRIWKFYGILTIAGFVLGAVAFIGAMIFAATMGGSLVRPGA